MRYPALTLLFTLLAGICSAQSPARIEFSADSAAATTIVDAINNADGTIYIYQQSLLDALVTPVAGNSDGFSVSGSAAKSSNVGYRIQVFSDNNMRTAKANAEYRKRMIEQQRPEWRTYISYEAPYWRVKVGDFRSQTEADAAMRELKSAFPSYADDMRLVREKVNFSQP